MHANAKRNAKRDEDKKIRGSLGACLVRFNAQLRDEAAALVAEGKTASAVKLDFELAPNGIVAPSAQLQALIQILGESDWTATLLPQDVGELGLAR